MYPHPTLDHIFSIINPKRVGDTGRQWKGHCPAHDDGQMSLTVGLGRDNQILFHCQAGCSADSVRQAFGLSWGDLASPDRPYERRRDYPRLHNPPKTKDSPKKSSAELQILLRKCEAEKHWVRNVGRYAAKLGFSDGKPFLDLGCRWERLDPNHPSERDPGRLLYPERNGDGAEVGIGVRMWKGEKRFITGSKRGLIYSPGIVEKTSGPIYLVEGFTDTAALMAMGLCVVGRPNNKNGAEYLATLLAGVPRSRRIVVVGENDQKSDGSWPGREGAEHTARKLADLLKRPVVAALVPEPFKDSREWFTAPQATTENLGDAYQRSLQFFATFPVQIPSVTEDELVAATVSIDSYSPYDHPEEKCQRPGHMLLKHLETHFLRNVLNRCGSSSCPQCFRRKKRLRYESMSRHIDARDLLGGGFYGGIREFTKQEWATLRRNVVRKGGNIIRFLQPDGRFAVLCTHSFPGSDKMSAQEAKEFIKPAIDAAVTAGKGKPFFSCTSAWAMVREQKERRYEKVGNLKITPQAVKRLCKQHRISYHQKQPADSALLLDGFIRYAAPDPTSDPFVALLLSSGTAESFGLTMHDSDTNPVPPGCKTPFPDWWNQAFGEYLDPTG